MGNYCCAIQRGTSAVWADDDEWGPMTQGRPMEKQGLLRRRRDDQQDQSYLSSVERNTGGQVRIRISKKQLEELLKKVEGSQNKKMKVDQALLQRLIDESFDLEIYHHHHHDHHDDHRSWKPSLQSIPEVN